MEFNIDCLHWIDLKWKQIVNLKEGDLLYQTSSGLPFIVRPREDKGEDEGETNER